jgi:inner membrane protein
MSRSLDPITQGALGAAWAQCGDRQGRYKRAAFLGILGGILPDVDVLIRSPSDSLLFLEYHRHFTHALAFIPVGGLIAALFVFLISRKKISIREAYMPCTLGYASHGLLDACTSYGTHLFWPFANTRSAWSIISIVDPLFTGALIVGVVLAARRCARKPVVIAMCVAGLYLALGAFQLHRAQSAQEALVSKRGHEIERGDVRPSIGQNLLYRAFYEYKGRYYADAIRVAWFSEPIVYPGDSIEVLDEESFWNEYELTETKKNDLERFRFFSAGYLVRHPKYPSMIADFRYAAIPNAIDPMWGIDVDTKAPNDHAQFKNVSRDALVDRRSHFFDMLLGR